MGKLRNRATSIVTLLTGFSDPLQTIRVFLGANPGETVVVKTRDGEYEFEVRGAFDTWILKETLLDDIYRTYGFEIQPDWTIVDIGAAFGDFSVLASRQTPAGEVFAYEPFPGSYELLVRNLDRNQAPNVTPIQAAVTARTREVHLDFAGMEPIAVTSGIGVDQSTGELVSSVTLEHIITASGIDRVDLLKIDCEGCEYEILLESPADLFEKVDRIVLETHERPISDNTQSVLVKRLRQLGYSVEAGPNEVHPKLLGFVRATRRPAELVRSGTSRRLRRSTETRP